MDGQELSGMEKNELAIFRRRKIGFIFQNYNLIPNLTVYDNIVLPVELDGRKVDNDKLEFYQSCFNIKVKSIKTETILF